VAERRVIIEAGPANLRSQAKLSRIAGGLPPWIRLESNTSGNPDTTDHGAGSDSIRPGVWELSLGKPPDIVPLVRGYRTPSTPPPR